MDKLMRLAGEVGELAEAGVVSAESIDELSADIGVPREKLYAGLAMSGLELKSDHGVQFVVCTGGCQQYGALECVSELLDIREDRMEAGDDGYDVIPRPCLNRCEHAPVVELRSPDGSALIGKATPASVSDAVDEIFS